MQPPCKFSAFIMGHLVPVLVSTIAGHRHFHAWHLHDLAGGTLSQIAGAECLLPGVFCCIEANQMQLSTCRLTASSIFGTWCWPEVGLWLRGRQIPL